MARYDAASDAAGADAAHGSDAAAADAGSIWRRDAASVWYAAADAGSIWRRDAASIWHATADAVRSCTSNAASVCSWRYAAGARWEAATSGACFTIYGDGPDLF